MKAIRSVFVLFALVLALPLWAQKSQQTPAVVGSTVTGTVLCSDTNAPARFARVLLKSTAPSHAGEDFTQNLLANMQKIAAKSGEPPKPMSDQQKKAMADAGSNMNRVLDMANSSTAGLDGKFSFAGIKAGTYYVHAIYPGYVDPFSAFSDADFASTDPAIRARIGQIPTITVTGSDAAHADLVLERGGAISGRIVYDDGSPAIGWMLSVATPGATSDDINPSSALMAQSLAISGAGQIFKTDDLGRYRIDGLTAGSYLVRASLTATPVGISATNVGDGGTGIALTAYSGNTWSRSDATPVTLTAGEDRPGVDITIPSHALHNIIGYVYAKSDGHTLNVGKVTLTSKSNPTLQLWAAVRDDGSFHFDYLPDGATYTLTVEGAADGKTSEHPGSFMGISIPDTTILRKYGSDTADVQLLDADVDSVKLTVAQTDWTPPPAKPGASGITPGDLLNGILGASSGDAPKQ